MHIMFPCKREKKFLIQIISCRVRSSTISWRSCSEGRLHVELTNMGKFYVGNVNESRDVAPCGGLYP